MSKVRSTKVEVRSPKACCDWTSNFEPRSYVSLLLRAGGLHRLLACGLPLLILGVAEVVDVHPRVGHFVDRPVSVSNPLIGIGVVLVGLRVVVERRDVDHRALWERRRRFVGVDVI